MTTFTEALINAEIEQQNKKAEKTAKKAYIADLMAQGIDKEMARIMAKTFFDSGLIKAM